MLVTRVETHVHMRIKYREAYGRPAAHNLSNAITAHCKSHTLPNLTENGIISAECRHTTTAINNRVRLSFRISH